MQDNNTDHYMNKLNDNRAKLHSALVKAIAETQDVHADSTNPFHKNKYASLGAHLALIKPIFAKHGLAVVQFPTSDENRIGVLTTIIHEEGSQMMQEICIPVADNVKGQDAGAIISYLRRYALAAVAGIATDDDDAESDRIAKTNIVSKPFVATIKKSSPAVAEVTGEVNFDLPVPFGKNKGTTLNNLPLSDLEYWATKWEPKPWEKTGKVGAKDLALKNSAQALWAVKSNVSEEQDSSEQADEVPF
jgi:uncharacterized protein (DUF3820 family)